MELEQEVGQQISVPCAGTLYGWPTVVIWIHQQIRRSLHASKSARLNSLAAMCRVQRMVSPYLQVGDHLWTVILEVKAIADHVCSFFSSCTAEP